MFTELFLFELKYRTKRYDTYLYFFVLFLFSIVSIDFLFAGELGALSKNAPIIIARSMGIVTALFLMIVSMVAGTSILRDYNHNTHTLLFAYPISKFSYLTGRFSGSFVTILLIFSAMPLGMMLSPLMPWQDPALFLDFSFIAYFQPFFYLVLPTLFFSSALFFVTGAISRKMLVVYIQGFFFLMMYLFALSIASGSQNLTLTALFEPFTFQSVRIVTATWSLIERNSMLAPMDGILLANRLLWFSLGIVTLGIGFVLFRFKTSSSSNKNHRKEASGIEKFVSNKSFSHTKVKPSFSVVSILFQLWNQTLFNVRFIISEISFWAILICAAGILLINGFNLGNEFGVNNLPTTYLIVGELVELTVFFFIGIVLFYSAELVWKERDQNLHLVTDTLPVHNWLVALGKLFALQFLLILLIALMIVVGILFQAAHGYYHFEILLYLKAFLLEIYPFLFLMSLVSFIVQMVSNQKYLAHLITVIFLAGSTLGFQLMSIEHPLLTFAGSMLPTYSDMNGYGYFLAPFLWLKTYWVLGTLLIFTLSMPLQQRGNISEFKHRIKNYTGNVTPTLRRVALYLFLGFIGTGGYLFYSINIENTYYSTQDQLELRVQYEQQFKYLEKLPQPEITAVNLALDIYPIQQAYNILGRYALENRSDEPISSIFIQKLPSDQVSLAFPSQPNIAAIDSSNHNFGLYKISLQQSLEPGDTLSIQFEQSYSASRLSFNTNPIVLENGSLIENNQLPSIGYLEDIELEDTELRKENGLPIKARRAPISDLLSAQNGKADGDGEYITFDATISTDIDQTVVAPGELIKSWNKNNRAYFQYSSSKKISNFYAITSAGYDSYSFPLALHGSLDFDSTLVEIYFHPGHEFNIPNIAEGISASLNYFSEHYSPYQFKQLRVAEVPLHHDRAQALPGIITIAENMGFTMDVSDQNAPDIPFFIAAHEVAHQWWGDQINPGDVQGKSMLSETLAQYSALMVFKNEFSEARVNDLLQWNMRQYFKHQAREEHAELPLYLVESGQDYIHYRKGLVAMYSFQQLVSEDSVNKALSRFIEDWNSENGVRHIQANRYPISTDLLSYFYNITPASLRSEVEEIFESITYLDNSIQTAEGLELTANQFTVTLNLEVSKIRMDSLGKENEITFNGPLEIGFYKKMPDKSLERISLRNFKADSNQVEYSFELSKRADIVILDPRFLLLDKNVLDNKKTIDWK